MTTTKADKKTAALEKAFLDVDQIAEDLIRLIGDDPKYKDEAVSSLKRIMSIKGRSARSGEVTLDVKLL